ncbi:MAG: hypothetical protein ACRDKH_00620 [Solirubrobacterales bacterium]
MAALALLSAATIAGCGGSDEGGGEEAEFPGGADPAKARVIDEWSSALRGGDVEAAAEFFEIPSVAQNGTPPLPLASREAVIAFNRALPCGAELIEAEAEGRYTIATFELTERPGAGKCGSGTGETARTAFVIEDGLIREWRRVPEEVVPGPSSDSPVV